LAPYCSVVWRTFGDAVLSFVPVILLMAGATAAVGFLPGYAVIDVVAPITLIMLRAGQGLAAGGELGVAGVLILESAPSHQRAGWLLGTPPPWPSASAQA